MTPFPEREAGGRQRPSRTTAPAIDDRSASPSGARKRGEFSEWPLKCQQPNELALESVTEDSNPDWRCSPGGIDWQIGGPIR